MGDALLPGRARQHVLVRVNVWDVYSKSEGKGLDGTFYKEW